MLEIVLTLVLLLLAAKKPRRRRRGVWAPRINNALSLSTLANNTGLGGAIGGNVQSPQYAISMDINLAMRGHTAGEGPLYCVVAHSDLADSEIEEWFESNGSWDRTDIVTRERARRPCRDIGVFDGLSTEETMNDGKSIRVKLGWRLQSGEGLKLWVMNKSGAALTTGTDIVSAGKVYLRNA